MILVRHVEMVIIKIASSFEFSSSSAIKKTLIGGEEMSIIVPDLSNYILLLNRLLLL